jgi:hypothetical protein
MPQSRKVFERPLNQHGDYLQIAITREGRTVTHYMVEYEALIEGEYRAVVRFDCSDNHPHRDTLDWNGETIHKRWEREGITRNEALREALEDLAANWE